MVEITESEDRIGQVLKVGDWFVHPNWPNPYQVVSFTPIGSPRAVSSYSTHHKRNILKVFRKDQVVKVPDPNGGESLREELQALVDAYQEDNERLTLQVMGLEKKIKEREQVNFTDEDLKCPEALREAMRRYLMAPRGTEIPSRMKTEKPL